jgi:hypothetical protein
VTHLFDNVFKYFKTSIKRCVESFFLSADDLLNMPLFFADLGENIRHRFSYRRYKLIQEGFTHAEVSSEAGSSPQEPAKNVAATFVGWCRPIPNCERQSPNVVSKHAHGRVNLELLLVGTR